MRILGFSKKWDKLLQDEFTTFRLPRRDRDWEVNEKALIVVKPRQKGGGERLGIAEISGKEQRSSAKLVPIDSCPVITDDEALADGFPGYTNRNGVWIPPYFMMWEWLWDAHDISRLMNEPINKLTLKWLES